MKIDADSVEEYLEAVPEDRKSAFSRLRQTILENIPEGFREEMSYGMIGYVIPHELYPPGYHVDPKLPLPFTNIASQKNFIGFYHSGIYAMPKLHDWFVDEYQKHSKYKLDMGKSCVRLKRPDDIPFELIGELMRKVTPGQFIEVYEKSLKNHRKRK
jgi:hypothetical protein